MLPLLPDKFRLLPWEEHHPWRSGGTPFAASENTAGVERDPPLKPNELLPISGDDL